ncbi:MAG TPA: hypothetical protein V6C81_06750 [Planktothrix sp.]|jgi:hypothetical protein
MSEENKTIAEASSGKPLPEYIPPPTVWPVTLALGTTLLAFGIVTSWEISAVGLAVFLLGAAGWFGDLRHDQLH